MHLAIAVAFLIGAVCAVRLPVLIFTLIVALVMVVFGAISYSSGYSLGSAALFAVIYAAALEGGYVLAHFVFYLVYVRRASRGDKRRSGKVTSKYSSE
jgi:hypothetical protein